MTDSPLDLASTGTDSTFDEAPTDAAPTDAATDDAATDDAAADAPATPSAVPGADADAEHDEVSLDEVVEEQLDVEADRHELPQTFADFGVEDPIVRALGEVGITHPFPIQALTLPVALAGHDIIGQAKTGTGKTLGFGIPLIQRATGPGEDGWDGIRNPGRPQALVIVPTRELAVQVAGDLETASRHREVRIVQLYGGRAYEPQVEALRRGAEVVVGTPGRMIDLMRQRALDLSDVTCVVLDEADEMLDLGFLPDVETLMSATSPSRHTMLFSATMPGAVVALARRYMTRPTHIRAHDPHDDGVTLKAITQFVYRAHALDKIEVLARILQSEGRGLTLVFARTKRTAARVAEDLAERGFASGAIHGDLGQGAREQALRAFRKGKIDVLVATDVAARGIDVENVTHVINYQCPEDDKTYLHRIGRTGRAGNTGTAVTFVDWDDVPRWGLIDKALGLGKPEPAETYSTSPHLYADLHIPEGTKGTLPRTARTRAGLDAEAVEDLGETGKKPQSRSGHGGPGHGRDGESRGKDDGRRGRTHDGGQKADDDGARRERRRRPGSGSGSGSGRVRVRVGRRRAAGFRHRDRTARGRGRRAGPTSPQPPAHARRPAGGRPGAAAHHRLSGHAVTLPAGRPSDAGGERDHGVGDELHRDRRQEQTGDPRHEGRPAAPQHAVDLAREPHRQVETHVHPHDGEEDRGPVVRRPVRGLDRDHRGDDRPGTGQQRSPQGNEGDVDVLGRRLRLLGPPGEQLHRDEQEQQPAGCLERGHGDVQEGENRLPEHRERQDHAQRHEGRVPGGAGPLPGGHRRSQGQEDRHRPRRIHDHEERQEGRGQERHVDEPAHPRRTGSAPSASMTAKTSGAVRFSPSRLGLPAPW